MNLFLDFWAWLSRWLPGNDEVVKEIIKWLILAGLGTVATWLLVLVRRRVKSIFRCADNARRLQRARAAVAGEKGVWLTEPRAQPENYKLRLASSIPIITLANLKGGVGKTTITANLAGACALAGENVLLIDLDFQGSLSSMMLGPKAKELRPKEHELSTASEAILGRQSSSWLVANARPSPVDRRLFAVPSFYDLARTENRLLIEWLIGDQPNDMPYFLAKLLLSDDVQRNFSRVLIDAPPRLSAACLQALCASTHLLIPTVMDQTSTEGVTTFVNEVEGLKSAGVCPHIQYIGVVGSMMPGGSTSFYEPAVKNLTDELRFGKTGVTLLPRETWIRDLPAIGRAAGLTVGILEGDGGDRKAIKDAFEPLASEVLRRAPSKGKQRA